MKLYLYRTCTRQLTTDGVLRNERGIRICDTAEYTREMLPEGTYKLKFGKCPKYRHRAPRAEEGAWIIHGNGVLGKGFGGSIIVGDHLVPGVVIRSFRYFQRLVKSMDKVVKRGGEVVLVIT